MKTKFNIADKNNYLYLYMYSHKYIYEILKKCKYSYLNHRICTNQINICIPSRKLIGLHPYMEACIIFIYLLNLLKFKAFRNIVFLTLIYIVLKLFATFECFLPPSE